MYQKISIVLILHSLVVLSWAWFYHQHLLALSDWMLNLISILTLGTAYGFIVSFLSNRQKLGYQEYLQVLISFLPLIFMPIVGTPYNYLIGMVSLGMTSFYLIQHLKLDQLQQINLLPISRFMVQTFTIIFTLFLMLMIYLLDLEGTLVHLFVHMVFLIFELCLILFLMEKENTYEKLYQLYYLSDYLAQDRDEFARIIHDDLIQDIYAAKNLLTMKSPDVSYVKEVLTQLEGRTREIMNFYQNHLFENRNLEDNLASILQSIQALYPQKELKINYQVSSDLVQSLDEATIRLLCILTKELVNNVYKHSQGTYLSYQIKEASQELIVEIESDGASAENLADIQNSKRGVFLLKMLVETQSGSLNYQLNGDVLSTRVCLKGESHENLTSG
ncbi:MULTISPECIES: sensor histidine kinase [Aerococcus]|uniref:Uncharacterized protein n=2 Tax=Aerococcus TaxID=1375 RepID=A0A178HEZ5_9LACT|nr:MULTISPECIES: hypothetical protein [Aerococcus]KAA9220406.1 hypothetical protein F6I39_01625 [Aerococcus loyolae]KAA9265538.1 hypothetical protein F6I19_04165 [Aerococcus loyolae]MCY3026319.1 hypothetical protein [Aerococcus loyolae]MCY3027251.1 hypothetical protein [Aerococcus loyolae]MCY3028873.1 hypothetical protein [Aerococcus loyolae]